MARLKCRCYFILHIQKNLGKAVEAKLGVASDHDWFVRTSRRNQSIVAKPTLEATKMIFVTAEIEKLSPEGGAGVRTSGAGVSGEEGC